MSTSGDAYTYDYDHSSSCFTLAVGDACEHDWECELSCCSKTSYTCLNIDNTGYWPDDSCEGTRTCPTDFEWLAGLIVLCVLCFFPVLCLLICLTVLTEVECLPFLPFVALFFGGIAVGLIAVFVVALAFVAGALAVVSAPVLFIVGVMVVIVLLVVGVVVVIFSGTVCGCGCYFCCKRGKNNKNVTNVKVKMGNNKVTNSQMPLEH